MPATALPHLPDALQPLQELALDLRWTWSHEADALWARVDADVWDRTQSPWAVLQNAPTDRLDALAGDGAFLAELEALAGRRRDYQQRAGWYGSAHPQTRLGGVAVFSMEFGLGAALPLYAGGLGVLVGDFLKAASDLGLPVVGVGLLYQEGYFRQMIDAQGGQHEAYPFNEPSMMPIEPAISGGVWAKVDLGLPGRTLRLRIWRAQIGRVTLYLLDGNDPLNMPADRGVTGKLYGGDAEMRLMQELVLGVGGWRALRAVGQDVEICHINEGHAAFAVIERALQLKAQTGLGLREALWASRPGNIFTSHTPVAAGFDRFEPDLLRRYLAAAEPELARSDPAWAEILALGRADAADQSEPFNMAYLAVKESGAALAVSRLHGAVSRRIFQPLFPRTPEREIPVGHVTNGVHVPSWDSAEADRLWTEACGKERWRLVAEELPAQVTTTSDEQIWAMRGHARRKLVANVRERLGLQLRERALEPEVIDAAGSVLDPNVLTLGFARRFTAYKRPALLLRDPERFGRLLLNPERPVQLVVSGKAHPEDRPGKAMISQWLRMAADPRLRPRLVFIEDYDIAVAQQLVQGVDVWISTSRRPWEACGTSGMKVLVNGGLNCSVRDGWWDEAFAPDLGWAFGEPAPPDDLGEQAIDAADAEGLYRVLETEVAPEFYDRDAGGVPRAWVARIRRSMSALTSRFSSTRMAREYLEQAYLPGADALRRRLADGGRPARELAAWAERLNRCWPALHIGASSISRTNEAWAFSVPILLGELTPSDVRVELYAEEGGGEPPVNIELVAGAAVPGSTNGYVYAGEAPGQRPVSDYTVRIRPARADQLLGAELPLILWQS